MYTTTLFRTLSAAGAMTLALTPVSQALDVRYGVETVQNIDIFYREAGDPTKTPVVLLHGFPSSSHMYRDVLAELGDEFYLIAPDYPGFGNSEAPSPAEYNYSFDNVADTIDGFLEQRDLTDYVLMIHDYGAPIGFRIATEHPDRVRGFVVMNGNAYADGIKEGGFGLVEEYWKVKDPALEGDITGQLLSRGGLEWQWKTGTRNPDGILPDGINLAEQRLSRENQDRIQLDLLHDYQTNVASYPTWQKYLRDNQPPMLIVWGKNDPIFIAPGAEAYKRDIQNIDFHLLDTGHFPLEEEADFIVDKMRRFLRANP